MRSVPLALLFMMGKPDEAFELARSYLARIQVSRHWEFPRDTLRYLGGLISEEVLLKVAGNSARDRGVAHYYIGIRRLADGDRAGAREHFEKSAASPVFHWGPVNRSRAFAARLARDPEWPSWLPAAPGDSAPK